ncbi:MAG: spore maturation protein A [Oscillospiraceae bacterium]|nr:spore maturation protein A [Oscillospiraceae bacterium]
MLNCIFAILIISAFVSGIISGNIGAVSEAVLTESVSAVDLGIYMLGAMCVWGGVMRVAEKSGITDILSKFFSPFLKLVFKGIDTKGKAFSAICMNITANLLGLGNAATPFGIEAMKELEKEDNCKETASINMIIFAVINTASFTIIPTTVAALRLKNGSENPLEILPAVIITSAITLIVSITFARILDFRGRKKN